MPTVNCQISFPQDRPNLFDNLVVEPWQVDGRFGKSHNVTSNEGLPVDDELGCSSSYLRVYERIWISPGVHSNGTAFFQDDD